MSKKSRKGLILLAGVLSFSALGLASCGEQTPAPVEPSKPEAEKITKVTITNKAALQAAWKVGEADRTIEFTVAPSTIKTDDPRITITSSAPEIIKVEGRTLKAVKAGRADITVKAGDVKDTVKIIVDPADVIVTGISITNKEEITATDWHVGDQNRELKISTNPETNIDQLIKDEVIKFTTSNDKVVQAAGKILVATGLGTAKITVTYTKGETVFKDDVDVTVKELPAMSIKESFEHAFLTIAKKGKTTKTAYNITARTVASNKDADLVIYDGEHFAAVRGDAAKKLKLGKVYNAQAKISNFYGNFQFDGGAEFKLVEDKEIAAPVAKTLTLDDIATYKASALAANSEVPSKEKIHYAKYGKVEALFADVNEAKGYYFFKPVGATADNWGKEDFIKVDEKIATDLYKEISIGETVELTGAINQYNSGSKYFGFIPNAIVKTKDAIAPTSMELTIPTTLKSFEQIDIKKMHKFNDKISNGPVSYEVVDDDDVIDMTGTVITTKKAGTFTITGVVNAGKTTEVKSQTVTVTVSTDKENNVLAKPRIVKTLSELAAMEAGAVKDELYEFTAQIVGYKDNELGKYGNLLFRDASNKDEEKPFGNYGTGFSLSDFALTEDGNIDKFNNPQTSIDNIGPGKMLEIGDVAKFAVFKDEKYDKNRFCTVLLEVVEAAETKQYNVTAVPEAFTGAEVKAYDYGTVLTLTRKDLEKEYDVTVNGTLIDPEEDGTYKVTVLPMEVKIEAKEKIKEIPTLSTVLADKTIIAEDGTHTKTNVVFNGILAGSMANPDNGVYVADGETSVFLYKPTLPEGVVIGDHVKVTGETNIFNGGFQIKSAVVEKLTEPSAAVAPVVIEVTTLEGIDGHDTGRKVHVTGVVDYFKDSGWNVEFKVKLSETESIKIRCEESKTSAEMYASLKTATKGTTVDLTGFVSFYVSNSGKLPLDAKNLQITNLDKLTVTPATAA